MGNEMYDDARSVLDLARDLISNDRANQHGDAFVQAATAASLWTAWLGSRGALTRAIEPYEVMAIMALLKLSRDAVGSFNKDTFVDLAGYAALAYAVRQKQVDLAEAQRAEVTETESDGA
jgi:hypothetical protein